MIFVRFETTTSCVNASTKLALLHVRVDCAALPCACGAKTKKFRFPTNNITVSNYRLRGGRRHRPDVLRSRRNRSKSMECVMSAQMMEVSLIRSTDGASSRKGCVVKWPNEVVLTSSKPLGTLGMEKYFKVFSTKKLRLIGYQNRIASKRFHPA